MLRHRERIAKEKENAERSAIEAIILLTGNSPGSSCSLAEICEITVFSTDRILIRRQAIDTCIRKITKSLVESENIEVKQNGRGRSATITLLRPINNLRLYYPK